MTTKIEINHMENLHLVTSNEPFKVYSLTSDGNGNEVEVFETAFSDIEEAKLYRPSHSDWVSLVISIENDY